MNASQPTSLIGPPKFVSAIVAGFNVVAGRIYLLILPIALDLLLWFGPHFRLKNLYAPIVKEMFQSGAATGLDSSTAAGMQVFFDFIFTRFNLLSLLSGGIVGVPSLMMGTLPLKTPLGSPPIYEVASWSQAISGWILFALLGLVLGCLYFDMISRATASPAEHFNMGKTVWETLQTLGMILFLLVMLFLLSIPFGLVFSLFAIISPSLSRIGLIICLFLVLWMLLPLIFTPHGIFAARQNAFRSMLISGRLVRALFPGVALFLMSAIIMAQGLGLLWHMPPEDSWLMLAGIFGNAFIGTGLLAASFVYYRGAAAWATRFRKETANTRIKV